MTGFDAARSFTACDSLSCGFGVDLAIAANQHPGYVLQKYWYQQHADKENIGDKLLYMPRHDYYSMGLVFLEIGMWRTLHSLLLQDLPLLDVEQKPPEPECDLDTRLTTLALDVMFARQDMMDGPDPEDEQEIGRREHISIAYLADGPRLIEEEGLTDSESDRKYLDKCVPGGNWSAWDVAYGLHKLREDALRICREKLGSRMGKRYREAVRRCLGTDFGVSPKASKNIDWLRAFNWRVVQDLNKCCA